MHWMLLHTWSAPQVRVTPRTKVTVGLGKARMEMVLSGERITYKTCECGREKITHREPNR